MKTIYALFFMLFTLTAYTQSETEITNLLNTICENSTCPSVNLGACPGDLDSLGEPIEFTDFQVYYVTENVILTAEFVNLRNVRLEFRNGANFVDNNIQVTLETDCDNEFTTEIVFIGGGQRFSSVEEMNATLSVEQLALQGITPYKEVFYNVLGKQVDINFASKGVYIRQSFYPNNLVKTTKIIN